jgi:crossover junction endodeoxyribonuclease RuvC
VNPGLMKILGIDPGSVNCGYGLISAQEAGAGRNGEIGGSMSRLVYISSGRIVMQASKPLHERLKELFTSLTSVIAEMRPDEVVIEKMFFAKGIKAALGLGHTRGVVLLAASMSGMPIHEYSPLEVKQAVVGYGRADKRQVQMMVQQILKIDHPLSPDGADALAMAICHMNMRGPCSGILSGNIKQGRRTAR